MGAAAGRRAERTESTSAKAGEEGPGSRAGVPSAAGSVLGQDKESLCESLPPPHPPPRESSSAAPRARTPRWRTSDKDGGVRSSRLPPRAPQAGRPSAPRRQAAPRPSPRLGASGIRPATPLPRPPDLLSLSEPLTRPRGREDGRRWRSGSAAQHGSAAPAARGGRLAAGRAAFDPGGTLRAVPGRARGRLSSASGKKGAD